jgi:hypothetical protein
MKTFLAVVLCSSLAFADPTPADAPLAATAVVVDVPGTSVHLSAGDVAPFGGRLISDEENIRRAKKEANERVTLLAAQENVLLSKPVVAALISTAAAAVITSITLGIVLAAKK